MVPIIFSMERHSRTAPPTDDLLLFMAVTRTHLLDFGSKRSTEFNEAEPSLPPNV
jgi:hypothetical protein